MKQVGPAEPGRRGGEGWQAGLSPRRPSSPGMCIINFSRLDFILLWKSGVTSKKSEEAPPTVGAVGWSPERRCRGLSGMGWWWRLCLLGFMILRNVRSKR